MASKKKKKSHPIQKQLQLPGGTPHEAVIILNDLHAQVYYTFPAHDYYRCALYCEVNCHAICRLKVESEGGLFLKLLSFYYTF